MPLAPVFRAILCVTTVASCLTQLARCGPVSDGHTIEGIEREIDLTNQYAVITETLQIQVARTGSGPFAVALCDLQSKFDRRAYGEVLLVKDRVHHTLDKLEVAIVDDIPDDVFCILAHLPSSVGAGDSIKLRTMSTVTDVMVPNPAKILQSETQRMVYEDSTYVLSPYPVVTQTTTVKLPEDDITDYSTLEPTKVLGGTIIYGRYNDVQPFQRHDLRVHFAHNLPFVQATKLVREIEISEWGNIYVEESYQLALNGAELQGPWSRFDFQRDPWKYGASACKELKADLPADAHSIYYHDAIGNISSSHVRRLSKQTEVHLQPRYPLFGGWKIDFVFGYSLPLEGYLWNQKDGLRRLEMVLGSSIGSLVVRELELRVVLPEGASSIEIDESIPFEYMSLSQKKYSYLDTVGRPVAVATKYNVVPDHATAAVIVKYRSSTMAQLHKPLLLVAVVFLCFVASMLYVRFELKISKEDSAKASRPVQKQKEALQKMKNMLKDRQGARDEMEKLLKEMKRTKDTGACSKANKMMEAKSGSSVKQLRDLCSTLEDAGFAQVTEVRELLLKERKLQDKFSSQCTLKIHHVQMKVSSQDADRKAAQGDAAVSELMADLSALSRDLFGS